MRSPCAWCRHDHQPATPCDKNDDHPEGDFACLKEGGDYATPRLNTAYGFPPRICRHPCHCLGWVRVTQAWCPECRSDPPAVPADVGLYESPCELHEPPDYDD